jgi:precorrin-2/cobalt-factor-2 C20-methyltransferase
MSGKLFAIGTGPGDADLLTVRAARCLAGLETLYAPAARKGGDSLALSIVREYLLAGIEIKERHFPMSHNDDEKNQAWDDVAEEIAQDVADGKQVGFVSLGDSMLFSTWVSLLVRLRQRIEIEIIPGITSFSCIAARNQFPLAMEQQSLAVIACTAPEPEIEQALLRHSSLVLMKVAPNFGVVKALLQKHHLTRYALLVSDASLENEWVCRDIESIDDGQKLSYFTTILVNKHWRA